MSETRMTIPARFHYTRLDPESVEVVLASDYDALQQQLKGVQEVRDGYYDSLHEAFESEEQLRQRLAEAQARIVELEQADEIHLQLHDQARKELAELKEIRDVQRTVIQAYTHKEVLS